MSPDARAPATERAFTVRGIRNGSLVYVTWRDGVLTGDPPTIDLIEVEALVAMQRFKDPVAAELYADAPFGSHEQLLGDPDAALFLIKRNVDIVREVEGAAPRSGDNEMITDVKGD